MLKEVRPKKVLILEGAYDPKGILALKEVNVQKHVKSGQEWGLFSGCYPFTRMASFVILAPSGAIITFKMLVASSSIDPFRKVRERKRQDRSWKRRRG